MTASDATSAYGCLLKAGDGAGTEVFTTIAEVTSFSYSGMEASFIDVTHMTSPNAIREVIPSLIEPGTISFEMNFVPDSATHDAIRTDLAARTKRNFKLVFTDATPSTWSFSGYYKSFAVNGEVGGKLQASASIQLTAALPTEA